MLHINAVGEWHRFKVGSCEISREKC